MARRKNTNFLIQGTILASAGILVRIIGLIYRVPLNRILGDEGAGYYSVAYDVYNILLLLSSMSLPIAVSKLVSVRVAKGEIKNSYRIFKGALLFGTVTGGLAGALAWFGADYFASLMKYPAAANALRVLAPTLFIVSIVGVFRGYYQGLGDMVPTAVSQIFEQIVNAIVSVVAAGILFNYGMNLTAVSKTEATTNACSWGAAGGTLGTCLGAVTALVFILVLFFTGRKSLSLQIKNDLVSHEESKKQILKLLFFTIIPVLLSTTIYQCSNLIDSAIWGNIMSLKGVATKTYSSIWGVYSSKYRVLTTVPIAVASSLSSSIVPSISMSYARNDVADVKKKIGLVIRFTMIIAIPCGIGLSVLGGPIVIMLFGSTSYDSLAYSMMLLSIFTVAAFSFSTITNAILQGIGKLNTPIKHSAISLIIHLVLLPCVLLFTNMNIYAIVFFDAFFALLVCMFNILSIRKFLDYSQEIRRTFIIPGIAGAGMGVVTYLTYFILHKFLSLTISAVISILIAIIVYFVLLLLLKALTKDELLALPKGALIVKIGKKFHII